MSMQINVDPACLTQEQREAVAGFILAYPGNAEVRVDTSKAVDALAAHAHAAAIPAAVAGAVDAELAALQRDHESTMPVAAFGAPDEAAAAFGVPTVPLVSSTPGVAGLTIAVPPPPVNTAPTTTTSGVAASGAIVASVGVELDKHGLPWDARIHAGTKRKNADNSWTAKRGVEPATVAAVEVELRQVMIAPPGVIVAPAATAPAAVTVGAAPGEVPADARQQFVGLVGRASAAIQGQKITQAEVNQICNDSGIPALPLLANRLDLVTLVAQRIDALITARG